ncbi:MAG: hypothetical protein SX243_17930 [Acidobacteriota bacterium]|nr:hypothetical protein [Acidobacteriota bacterium]
MDAKRRTLVAEAHSGRWWIASAFWLVLLTAAAPTSFAQPIQPFWDPGTTQVPLAGPEPDQLTVTSSALFFAATTPGAGRALWVSDGTAAGTHLLRDTVSELTFASSNLLTASGSRLFFSLSLPGYGRELWTTDGSAEGTGPVADLCPGACGDIAEMAPLAGERVVLAQGLDFRFPAVWVSDGTGEGTKPLIPTLPGDDGVVPWNLVSAGDRVFFIALYGALDPEARRRLFVTDGTPEGTFPLTGDDVEVLAIAPRGEEVLFLSITPALGLAWWRSDGTAAGTEALVPLAGHDLEFPRWTVRGFLETPAGTILSVFEPSPASDPAGIGRCTLWQSDGTAQGTRRWVDLSALDSFTTAFAELCPADLVAAGSEIFFAFVGGSYGRELWVTDGTVGGTRVLDRHPGPPGSDFFGLQGLGEEVYFLGPVGASTSSDRPLALWRSDGTLGGTAPLVIFGSRRRADFGDGLVTFEERLYFSAAQETGRSGLWTSDGTAAGTFQVSGLGDPVSVPGALTAAAAAQAAYFVSDDAAGVASLWRTDGTAEGTSAVYIPPPGLANRPWIDIVTAGDQVFFQRFDEFGHLRLWVSDGTAGGTRPVDSDVEPFGLAAGGPGVCFSGRTAMTGLEPWCSDGTAAGTVLLRDIAPGEDGGPTPGPRSSLPGGWVPVGERMLFQATGPTVGRELWETDGTPAGTRLVGDLRVGPADSEVLGLAAVGPQRAFFVGRAPFGRTIGGYWIWALGRQSSRIFRARPLIPLGLEDVVEASGAHFRARYFAAVVGRDTVELWRSAGSAASTDLLARIPTASTVALPLEMTVVGNDLYFVIRELGAGGELWATDGTAEGTRRVLDLVPGLEGSDPHGLTALGSVLLFTASDRLHGSELWVSDGTAEGTRLVADLEPGPGGSSPRLLAVLETAQGPRVVLSAWRSDLGFSLWSFDGNDLASRHCEARADRICLGGGRFELLADWRDPRTGSGGRARDGGGGETAGAFWFSEDDNLEVPVKILNGSGVNGQSWLFYSTLTHLPFWLSVADLQTGRDKTYTHAFRDLCGEADLHAFPWHEGEVPPAEPQPESYREPSGVSTATPTPVEAGLCSDDPTALCYLGGRFRARVSWRDPRPPGREGVGKPTARDGRTGSFWFFQPSNPELYLKILDGSAINRKYWVFFAPLTDLGVQLAITDTRVGNTVFYHKASGELCGRADTRIFRALP